MISLDLLSKNSETLSVEVPELEMVKDEKF